MNPYCVWYAEGGRRSRSRFSSRSSPKPPRAFGRAEDLLESRQVVRPREHLRGRALDAAELLGDVDGRLARALLRREQPSVEALEAAVDLASRCRSAGGRGLDPVEATLEPRAAVRERPERGRR